MTIAGEGFLWMGYAVAAVLIGVLVASTLWRAYTVNRALRDQGQP